MTNELTLREKVIAAMDDLKYDDDYDMFVNAIATILEDTGSPAHMRVAAELRGE